MEVLGNGSTKSENIKTKKTYSFGKLEVDCAESFRMSSMS